MKNCKEKDFHVLKEVSTGRLSPNQMGGFFWGAFIFSVIITLVSYNATLSDNVTNPLWPSLITVLVILLSIQLILTMVFTSPKVSYRFQRTQMILLSVVTLKLSMEFYLIYFLAVEDRYLPNAMNDLGFLMLVGGNIFLILSVIRGVNRIKQGHFRKNGKGLYHFTRSKGYLSLPFIYGASVFGGVMARALSDASDVTQVLYPLLFCVVIQYGIAVALPEFILLAYCKFRFKSFRYIPKRYR